ncbi:TetR/AcrR family transcriptional regulator [Pseudonocardia eucalypti]|uniref:TetR/AcrR family transcriptional regulator n=1 Tax=Pseudonocardia eucalypti TaxID=648755 RepID=A0ABP9REM1_9PSEU|nr:AcrR family transcriptional regulator [Pseudonocardia eucalypti]
MSPRTATGAAVLRTEITRDISRAVFDELVEHGYARVSMEAVAKRAGVGKSALYRRWPGKRDMVIAVLADFSVPRAVLPDTGSLRGDVLALLHGLHEWVTHPAFGRILADLVAEANRDPGLAEATHAAVGEPRRALAADILHRAIARDELPADLDVDVALDVLAGPLYWRVGVRSTPATPDYLDRLADFVLRALGA